MDYPHKINKVQIRNLQIEDYAQLSQSFTRVYSDGSDVFWTHEQIEKLIKIFPEGQIVTVVDEKIVGCALSIIVEYDKVKNDHTYAQVTGKETFNTHSPQGNILYGIEVFIRISRVTTSSAHVRISQRTLRNAESESDYVWRSHPELP
jgi:hypothetical protein